MSCRSAMNLFSAGLTIMAGLALACHAPRTSTPPQERAPEPEVIAFVAVDVVPMDSERILDDQTVLVRGDRIAALGPAGAVTVPAGATVIDGSARYLMPGLVDMHVHLLAPDQLPLFVANGVTGVRNMWGTPDVLALRDRVAAGTLLGPTIYTTGPIIDGVPAYWPGSESIDDPSRADELVASHERAGYQAAKLYMNLDRPTYKALIAAARKHALLVAGHVPTALGMREVLAYPMDSLEHMWGYFLDPAAAPATDDALGILTAEAQSWLDASDADMDELARALAGASIWSCVTLTSRKRAADLENPEAAFAGVKSRFVSPLIKHIWLTGNPYALLPAAKFEVLRKSYGKAEMMIRALHLAGARILLGTDTPNPFVVSGFSAHEELANLVAAGLTPYQAIRAGTHDAAEFLGQATEFGTIAVGSRADLLLVEGNPLQDVSNVAKITGVMLRGRWLPGERLQRMLDDMVASFTASDPTGVTN